MHAIPITEPAAFVRRSTRRALGVSREIPRRIERRRLLSQLQRGGVCAEIGTWRGDFAERILASRRPRTLYLVDPWEHRSEGEYERALFGGGGAAGQSELDAVHRSVLERFAPAIEQGQVHVRRQRSVEAAASFADASLDWVYIDGDHTYEAVRADLEAYYRVVRPGGFLAGDDYGVPGWWGDGVTQAVDEFAVKTRMKVIGTQFLLEKSS